MEEEAILVTREQYIEMLIDDSFRDADEMESGFLSWCERHVPIWREQGHDETWIRQVRRIGAYEIPVKHGRGREQKPLGQGLTRSGNTKATVACP